MLDLFRDVICSVKWTEYNIGKDENLLRFFKKVLKLYFEFNFRRKFRNFEKQYKVRTKIVNLLRERDGKKVQMPLSLNPETTLNSAVEGRRYYDLQMLYSIRR